MKYLFVYFAEELAIARVAGESGLFKTPLGFDERLPFYVMSESANEPIEYLDSKNLPRAILVFERIEIDNFVRNISKICTSYEKIVIVWHGGSGKTYSEMNSIKQTIEAFNVKCAVEHGSTLPTNKFFGTALNFISARGMIGFDEAGAKAAKIFEPYWVRDERLNNRKNPPS